MSVISHRGDVKREILALLEATQDTDYQSRVNVWFELGMDDVYSALRAWWAIRAAQFTVEDDGQIYLPPSYLAMQTVIPQGGHCPLQPIAIDQAAPYLSSNIVGPPIGYLIEGRLLTLLPVQTAPFTARCTYYSKLEPLNDDTDTSLYIEHASSAILYAAASHGALYRGDQNMASSYAGSASSRVEAINAETQRAAYGSGIIMQRVR